VFACFCCLECDLEHEIDCYGNGSECVAVSSQCDGIAHCSNGQDESVERCGTPHEGIHSSFHATILTRVFTYNLLWLILQFMTPRSLLLNKTDIWRTIWVS